MILLAALLCLTTSIPSQAGDADLFSGCWRVIKLSIPHSARKNGIELSLKRIEFQKNDQCVFIFTSSKDEAISLKISHRFVAGFKELVLIAGDRLEHASVEIYQWHKAGDHLILEKQVTVGGPDSPLPDIKDMDEIAADLATKLSRVPKIVTTRMTLERATEQDSSQQPPVAPEPTENQNPKLESEAPSK